MLFFCHCYYCRTKNEMNSASIYLAVCFINNEFVCKEREKKLDFEWRLQSVLGWKSMNIYIWNFNGERGFHCGFITKLFNQARILKGRYVESLQLRKSECVLLLVYVTATLGFFSHFSFVFLRLCLLLLRLYNMFFFFSFSLVQK